MFDACGLCLTRVAIFRKAFLRARGKRGFWRRGKKGFLEEGQKGVFEVLRRVEKGFLEEGRKGFLEEGRKNWGCVCAGAQVRVCGLCV